MGQKVTRQIQTAVNALNMRTCSSHGDSEDAPDTGHGVKVQRRESSQFLWAFYFFQDKIKKAIEYKRCNWLDRDLKFAAPPLQSGSRK